MGIANIFFDSVIRGFVGTKRDILPIYQGWKDQRHAEKAGEP